MFPMLACVGPWERQLLHCTGPGANRHMGWGQSGHDWMEVKGTQAVSSRVCMEPHILTDIKTTKKYILFIWDGTEFTGSVPGKSHGRFKGSGDLQCVAAISFTYQN